MPTKKVKNRILFLIVAASIFLLFIFFVLKTLNKNLLYFSTPTDVIKNDSLMIGKKMRLGGMVKKNSILARIQYIFWQWM